MHIIAQCVTYQRVHDALQTVLGRIKHVAMTRETCRDCGDMLVETNRRNKSISKKGKQYYLNRCRSCISDSDTLLRQYKKKYPKPPSGSPCACCNKIAILHCDHSHDEHKPFRGWICQQCNSGLGLLGDSEAGLRQALPYLERVLPKSRSCSPSNNKTDDTDQNDEMASSRSDDIEQGSKNMPTDK